MHSLKGQELLIKWMQQETDKDELLKIVTKEKLIMVGEQHCNVSENRVAFIYSGSGVLCLPRGDMWVANQRDDYFC